MHSAIVLLQTQMVIAYPSLEVIVVGGQLCVAYIWWLHACIETCFHLST